MVTSFRSSSPEHSATSSTKQYTSDDSLVGTSQHERKELRNQRRMQRKQERYRRRQQLQGSNNGAFQKAPSPYNMVILLLGGGLIFCLLDSFYIMSHMHRATDNEQAAMIAWAKRHTFARRHDHPDKPETSVVEKNHHHQVAMQDVSDMLKAKEPILNLIREAGIAYDPEEDLDLLAELPDWDDVVTMYGAEPVLYGVNEENCKRFQEHSDPGDHFLGVAGTFNSGTNLMAELLTHNCIMPDRMKKHGKTSKGIRWQVPWGKHTPPGDEEYRNAHRTTKDWNVDSKEIMPVVTIRDPLIWLKSMCKHPYTARWYRPNYQCPNFSAKPTTTSIKYADFHKRHDSILHHWNDYYQEYLKIDIPIMMVRFEDLVFHPKEVTKQVCECAGGKLINKNKFIYIVESAKKGVGAHGKVRTGFVDAIVRYGTEAKRYNEHTTPDLEFVRDNIDAELMDLMKYSPIDPAKASA